MTELQVFGCGFLGSCAVEAVTALHFFHNPTIVFPERYRRWSFWLLRAFIAVLAGGLAVAYEIDRPLVAINIGASAPLILQALGTSPVRPPAGAAQPAGER